MGQRTGEARICGHVHVLRAKHRSSAWISRLREGGRGRAPASRLSRVRRGELGTQDLVVMRNVALLSARVIHQAPPWDSIPYDPASPEERSDHLNPKMGPRGVILQGLSGFQSAENASGSGFRAHGCSRPRRSPLRIRGGRGRLPRGSGQEAELPDQRNPVP